MKVFTLQQAEKLGFNGDIIDNASDPASFGYKNWQIVEATALELAHMCVGSFCGETGNQCFKKIAAKYPDLLVRGFVTEDPSAISAKETLLGFTIVFTGKLESMPRAEAFDLVEQCGGVVGKAVSNDTSVLVATKTDGVKYKKALALGIPIWSEDEFIDRTKNPKRMAMGSADMKISSPDQGHDIEELAAEGGGSYRYDECGQEWEYFETE